MKKKLLFISAAFLSLNALYAQDGVGMGTSFIPNQSAVLDIGAGDKGVLIPRVTLKNETDNKTIQGTAYPESLLVYHIGAATNPLAKGFYFWSDGKWNALLSKTSNTTSEALTVLTVANDTNGQVVLFYKDEKGTSNPVELSTALQTNDKFREFIGGLVNSTAAGVELKSGNGINVKTDPPVAGSKVTTYTISTVPAEISLVGDVSGTVAATSVDKIKGIPVLTPAKTDGGQALVYDSTANQWKVGKPLVDNTSITDKANLSTDGIIVVGGPTSDVKEATETVLKATTLSIKNASIPSTKIKGEGNDMVLSTDASGNAVWTAKNTIAKKETLTTDGIIVATGADTNNNLTDAVLKATTLSIKEASIPFNKIKGQGNDMVLSTDASGNAVWTAKNTIAKKETLTTDGIIVATGADTNNNLTDAVLKATTLSIKDGGIVNAKIADGTITVGKLATVATNKNQRLTTDATGKPQWESKFTTVTTAAVPTNEVVDGNRVYTVRVTNGTVKEPMATGTPLGYNSIIEPIAVKKFGYLLTADIYGKDKKLLLRNVTDVVNTTGEDGTVQFRFGMGNSYSTLPVGTEYIVMLRYVSTEEVK